MRRKPWKDPVSVAYCNCAWKFIGPYHAAESELGHHNTKHGVGDIRRSALVVLDEKPKKMLIHSIIFPGSDMTASEVTMGT